MLVGQARQDVPRAWFSLPSLVSLSPVFFLLSFFSLTGLGREVFLGLWTPLTVLSHFATHLSLPGVGGRKGVWTQAGISLALTHSLSLRLGRASEQGGRVDSLLAEPYPAPSNTFEDDGVPIILLPKA